MGDNIERQQGLWAKLAGGEGKKRKKKVKPTRKARNVLTSADTDTLPCDHALLAGSSRAAGKYDRDTALQARWSEYSREADAAAQPLDGGQLRRTKRSRRTKLTVRASEPGGPRTRPRASAESVNVDNSPDDDLLRGTKRYEGVSLEGRARVH